MIMLLKLYSHMLAWPARTSPGKRNQAKLQPLHSGPSWHCEQSIQGIQGPYPIVL